MKRILKTLLPVIAIAFLFSACYPPARTASGPAGPSIDLFTGSWTVDAVTFSNLTDDAVQTAFDQAPPKDFIGSKWQLNKDGKGSYTLANGTTQTIYWSVNGGDALGSQFHFKKVNAGQNPDDVTNGYQLVISANTGTAMTLKALVYTGNKNGYVVYTFSKAK
jgi:hypothetical protein